MSDSFAQAKLPKTERERGSEEHHSSSEPRFLAVGQVVGVHGLRGELKVEILTSDPNRFFQLETVLVGRDGQEPRSFRLLGVRLHKGRALLKLEGCSDRSTAEGYRGCLIQIPVEEALSLQEGEYYEHQIIGLEVGLVSGEPLGRITEIIYTGANEVYVVRQEGAKPRELLLPALADVILDIDLDAGRMVVELPEGLS